MCSANNSIPGDRFHNIIFKVIVQNDIINRFDTSNEFWEKFLARDKILEKKLGYFDIESINNPCQVVIAVNPKKYYKHSENFSSNKKHKGIRKGEQGMEFENFASRIATSRQIDNFQALKYEYVNQSHFTTIGGEMQQTTIVKTKFSQTNDTRFYNLNCITSLPLGHPYLKNLTSYKESKGEKIEKYFLEEKNNFEKLKSEAFSKDQRLSLYNQILAKNFEYYDLKDNIKIDTG